MFDIIKSYLVELGVQIDQPGFDNMQSTLQKTDKVVAASVSGWAKSFAAAGTIITGALTTVTSATAGLMANIAKQDLEMEKYARSMMMGKDAAMQMKLAVAALGHSIEEIAITPELRNQYSTLIGDAAKMKVGGDFEAQTKNMREIMFEFTRLKQEASYALQWIGYYLYKNLTGPLGDVQQKFKGLNDSLIKNMPLWTKKAADGLTHIINIGLAAARLIKNVTSYLGKIWDSFPRGVKIAIVALTALFTFIRVSPVGKFIMLLGTALLLVEDFFGYIDGKKAAFGSVWDKLIEYAGNAEIAFDELKAKAVELFDEITNSQAFKDFIGKLEKTGVKLYGLAESGIKFLQKTLANLFRQIEQSGAIKEFIEVILELSAAFHDLAATIFKYVILAIADLYKYLNDTGSIDNVSEAIKSLWSGIVNLGKGFANLLKETKRYFDYVKSQDSFKEWWNGLRQVLKGVIDVAASVLTHLGNIGNAVGLLMQGKFKEAAITFGESYAEHIKKAFGGFGDIISGSTGVIKGNLKGYGDTVLWSPVAELFKYFGSDSGEGKTWTRKAGADVESTREETKAVLDVASQIWFDMTGKKLMVTSGTDGRHAGGEYSHGKGWKLDITDGWDDEILEKNTELRREFIKRLEEFGVEVIDEYINTSGANWTGGHLDLNAKNFKYQEYQQIKQAIAQGSFPVDNTSFYSDLSKKEKEVIPYVAKAAQEYNLDPNLLLGLIKAESSFDADAESSAGAKGYTQLMPDTARGLGVKDINDPEQNIFGGAKYLRQMLDEFNGNIRLALAAYNAGPGNAKQALRENWKETIGHGEKVLKYRDDYAGRAYGKTEFAYNTENFGELKEAANALLTAFQQERSNMDPRLAESIVNRKPSNNTIYNNGGNTTVHLSLGDVKVNVAQTNASPQEIGDAVQKGITYPK